MRIVIIGGGPGGYEAAIVAAEAGVDVTIVSNDGLGGNSVRWDCVPSKALIVSAQAMGWAQSAHRLGVRLSSGADIGADVFVDMPAVLARIRALADDQSDDISKTVAVSGARLVRGTGRLAGRDAVEVTTPEGGTTVLPADTVLIATGSAPRVLPIFVPDGKRVFTARELFSLDCVPERLIIVGSGATGAEYAHAFARFGSEVHLVSSRDQILPSEDPDAAAVIEEVFERRGMIIHRRRRAVDFSAGDDGVRVKVVETRDGAPIDGTEEWIDGSHALWCVGQVPQSARLGLEAAGVALDRGAVVVDRVSRTNVHTIYAAGDVTGGVMLASSAAMQGRTAMWHALGQAVTPIRWDTLAACIFTDPEVAAVGVSEQEAAAQNIPIVTVGMSFATNPRGKMAQDTDGFVKLHCLKGSGTVLGGSVVAAGASDLIHPISVAVRGRLTVNQLSGAFSIYPSMSGSLQEAARKLMSDLAERGGWM